MAGSRGYFNLETQAISPGMAIVRDTVLFLYLFVIFAGYIFKLGQPRSDLTFDPYAAGEGSIFEQIRVGVFLCVGIWLQFVTQNSWRSWNNIISILRLFTPLLFWILFSIVWSDFPDISMRRGLRFLIEFIALICFAATYSDQYRLLRVVFLCFGFIVILDIALFALPDVSYTPIGYAGVHGEKNQAGAFCFVALSIFLSAFLVPRIFPVRLISLGLVGLCVWILSVSLCKTAWGLTPIVLLVTSGLMLIRRLPPSYAIATLGMGGLGAIIASALIANLGRSAFLIATVDDPTLTDRDRVWDYVLYRFSESPIIGHGYGALWNTDAASFAVPREFGVSINVGQAHNGYIDILAQLGVVGLILTILLFVAILFRLVWTNDTRIITFIAIYITIGIFLYNITESTLLSNGSELWVYFVLIISYVLLTRGKTIREAARGRPVIRPGNATPSRTSTTALTILAGLSPRPDSSATVIGRLVSSAKVRGWRGNLSRT